MVDQDVDMPPVPPETSGINVDDDFVDFEGSNEDETQKEYALHFSHLRAINPIHQKSHGDR
jgi:hypothetical protein